MQIYRLKGPGMIDPRWINSIPYGRKYKTSFSSEKINFEGEYLVPKNPIPLPEGEEIYVWITDHFYCCSVAEYDQRELDRKAKAEREQMEQEERRLKIKKADHEFNKSLNIPFKWITGIKPVLSGLSAKSWGDGANRRTVTHILVKEDIKFGRLVRSKNDFLCTKDAGKFSDLREEGGENIDGEECLPKVTCKQCLARLETINKRI